MIENNLFQNDNYRKIKKKLIKDIVKARIEEILDIILFQNVNMKYSLSDIKRIIVVLEDDHILNNFKDDFNSYLSKDFINDITILKDFEIETIFNKAAHLSVFGWKKEAIPILQTKNSLITRIFKGIFE